MNLVNILYVAAGGALGSVIRYVVSIAVPKWQMMPIATISVNIIGSLLIGIIIGVTPKTHPTHLIAAIGFCGGFTTFSTFSLETVKMFEDGYNTQALLYILISIATCLGATILGLKIAKIF